MLMCRLKTTSLEECYCTCEKNWIKPFVAPEGAARNLIYRLKWCHLSQSRLLLNTRLLLIHGCHFTLYTTYIILTGTVHIPLQWLHLRIYLHGYLLYTTCLHHSIYTYVHTTYVFITYIHYYFTAQPVYITLCTFHYYHTPVYHSIIFYSISYIILYSYILAAALFCVLDSN